ncbi:PIN domain-containing protein [Vibrio natriegens]|uniref:PIN domain-containing protein n=2 Tax=Vibrio harveyi group TaxID=717610 RepID=UPI003DA19390
MSRNSTINEDFEMAMSYKQKFESVEHIFSSDKTSVEDVKEHCIVVLDTNVLLIPYKLKNEDANEIEKVYDLLSKGKRLFLPEHVAREFAVNKQSKLSDLYKSVNDRIIRVQKLPDAAILKGTTEYNDLEKEYEALDKALQSYNKSVKGLASKIKDWSWDDPILRMYGKFFNSETIVSHKKSDDELKKDLERRQKHSIAPGYKDKAKSENSAGDLNVWLTILELGKTLQADVVFVSEDRKPDWWNQSNGSPFSPKFELINEYKLASNGKSIHFLIFSEFLKLFNVSEEVIEDVKKSEIKSQEEAFKMAKKQHMKLRKRFLATRMKREYLAFLEQEGKDPRECEGCGYIDDGDRSILEFHHLVPLSEGGDNSFDNLLLLCPNCHRLEHKKLRI